jgi:hypothetical protein
VYLVVVKPTDYGYLEGSNDMGKQWSYISNHRGHRAEHVHKGKPSELGISVLFLAKCWETVSQHPNFTGQVDVTASTFTYSEKERIQCKVSAARENRGQRDDKRKS